MKDAYQSLIVSVVPLIQIHIKISVANFTNKNHLLVLFNPILRHSQIGRFRVRVRCRRFELDGILRLLFPYPLNGGRTQTSIL